ncbi:MAG TPA: diaminobutyrate--2-oxoglutarate transaminase, partial [Ruminococcaceae bacterium]|nr:diaminobutyrate--2-oxoglutarate transaminase [Oscillospiraceae bacterium]
QRESNVRSYCRRFTETFVAASGCEQTTQSGKTYLDFFAGAGALNYGHNNPYIMGRVIEYLNSGGVIHSLDMHTAAKREFLTTFTEKILKPRGLSYRVQFCGPTGTNGVEAALKLARKAKGREGIFSFMGGFHGVTMGSLSATGGQDFRNGAGRCLSGVTFFPYPGKPYDGIDVPGYIRAVLDDDHSGVAKPAAIILETVQAEGGVNVAPIEFLKEIRRICDERDILMICDDVQVGCFRTGGFFSFERAGIQPDMVILSKSISGCGFPMSLMLMKPECDVWNPGEHSGTFRGYQPAFVGAKAAIEFAEENNLPETVRQSSEFLLSYLRENLSEIDGRITAGGVGLIIGIDYSGISEQSSLAGKIAGICFERGLLIETAGRGDEVLKLLPPLTTPREQLKRGCDIILESTRVALG